MGAGGKGFGAKVPLAGAGGWERASRPGEHQRDSVAGTKRVRAEHLLPSPPGLVSCL